MELELVSLSEEVVAVLDSVPLYREEEEAEELLLVEVGAVDSVSLLEEDEAFSEVASCELEEAVEEGEERDRDNVLDDDCAAFPFKGVLLDIACAGLLDGDAAGVGTM